MPNIDDIYKSKYTGEEIDALLDKVQLQDFTYDSLKNKPIINQDLLIGGFTPQENTYYRHTGTTNLGFATGIIYLYSGGKYTSIKGGGSGGGYILPVATGTRLGGVKIGDGLEITEDGTLSAKSTGGVGKQGTGTGAEIFNSYEGEEANTASGNYSHAEGGGTEASGSYSHAEGGGAKAIGDFSHAEGYGTQTVGERSHAEGDSTLASGFGSHAEGDTTEANGRFAHAEGTSTKANGENTHAEGEITTASGKGSHAEGLRTTAGGNYSHAEGTETIASGDNQHVQGRYNIEDTNKKYAHIVGNGTGGNRSNAHTLDWDGNAWFAGKASGGTEANPAPVENANDYVTKKYFEDMSKGGAPINEGDTLSKVYFDTEKTPDLSIFTYTLDENMGFYTAGLIGFKNASNEYIGYLSAVKVNDTVYALIYENRVTGDISYLYVSDNIEYGGTSFSKGWQNFNNPFPVTSATVVDVDQTATKPWNGVWVSKKAFYARTDEIPAEPNNGTLTIQKNGTTVGTFGANQSENTTANITVPTKVSQLQNDAGYTKNKGTVISVRVNGTTYTADANGLVDLGTISGGTAYRSIYNSIY